MKIKTKFIVIFFIILVIVLLIIKLVSFNCYYFLHKYYIWEKKSDDIEIIGKYNIDPKQKKIISVSLFGTNNLYFDGALQIKDDIPKYFPGWQLRVYMHYKVDPKIIDKFLKKGVQVIMIKQDNVTPSDSTFWRFLAAEDDIIFISRDADYKLNEYDYIMTEKWINDGSTKFFKFLFFDYSKIFYWIGIKMIGNGLIHAGRWGGRDRCVPDMLERINNFKKRKHWHSDEVFLQSVITEKQMQNKGIMIYLDYRGQNMQEYFLGNNIKLKFIPEHYELKKYDLKENNKKRFAKLFEYFK